jgi:hypothetical protein
VQLRLTAQDLKLRYLAHGVKLWLLSHEEVKLRLLAYDYKLRLFAHGVKLRLLSHGLN